MPSAPTAASAAHTHSTPPYPTSAAVPPVTAPAISPAPLKTAPYIADYFTGPR